MHLFIIVKVVNSAAKRKEELEAKRREAYYEKHPEERPVEPEPEAPKPTQEELLTGILAELKKQNA
jgi:large-conductance mechanosensitive channel